MDANVQKFVFSSTCAVYGVPERIPIVEDTPRQPVNPYGCSKLFFEHALEAYGRAYGMGFASLRYFNAGGADESGEIGELHNPETHLIPPCFVGRCRVGTGTPDLWIGLSDARWQLHSGLHPPQ